MNQRCGRLLMLLLFVSAPAAAQQETLFFAGFEFGDRESYGLLESADLNGAHEQVGFWSGDDFPEADANGYFAGGVIGGDSAGLVNNPHGGQMLLVDRPLDDALHFMNLARPVPHAGTRFSFDAGTSRNGVGGAADFDFFGLDPDGNESFRIRIGADVDTQRLGYVAGGDVTFDLPTTFGEDRATDFASAGTPPYATTDSFANVSVNLRQDGFTIDYAKLNSSDSYTTSVLPFNSNASALSRVGLYYRGAERDVGKQSGFFVDNLRVTVGEPAGEFSGFINALGKIVVEGEGQDVVGLDFISNEGRLVPQPTSSASPFQFLLSNSSERVTFGNLASAVTIDGRLALQVGYSGADPENELVAAWGDQAAAIHSFTVVLQDPSMNCPPKLLLDELGLVPGDVNSSGFVDFADFLAVSVNFGREVAGYSAGDVDCSGLVEFADFLVVSENFGKASNALVAVPEPDAMSLLWVLLVGLAGCRRRR